MTEDGAKGGAALTVVAAEDQPADLVPCAAINGQRDVVRVLHDFSCLHVIVKIAGVDGEQNGGQH